MNQLNPKANNWILPIRGDVYDGESFTNQLREHGMSIKINWQPAETFNWLNEHWWPNYFRSFGFKDLVLKAKLLGIKPIGGKAKGNYVLALVNHYQGRFQ